MQVNSDHNALKMEILQALRNAAERQESVILSPKEKPISLFSRIESVSEEYVAIQNSIPPIMAPYIMGAPAFQILLGSYWIGCEKFRVHGKELRLPVVDFGCVEMARASERVCFSENEDARVRIAHPFDSGAHLWRRVYDFSDGGMSFRSRLNTPFMQPGRVLPSLEFVVGGETRSQHSGQVVYVRHIIDISGDESFQVGVRFDSSEKQKV